VKFSDEFSIHRGSDRNAEWCFRYQEEIFDYRMETEKGKPHRMCQMVRGLTWLSLNCRVERSKYIIIESDFKARKLAPKKNDDNLPAYIATNSCGKTRQSTLTMLSKSGWNMIVFLHNRSSIVGQC
jgi:hypothetical protein